MKPTTTRSTTGPARPDMAGDTLQTQATPTTRYTVWDGKGWPWVVEWPGPFQGDELEALGRVTAAAAGEPFPGDAAPIDLPADVGLSRRARARLKARPSSPAAHRVDADDREAVGGAAPAELAKAAEADGATFVQGSDRARAHVRKGPPARRKVILPTSAAELDGAQGAPVTLHIAGGPGGQPRPIPAAHVVLEAAALITSHDARTFAPHPDYPAGVQERDYTRDPYERRKVEDNAARLIPDYVVALTPDATTGPPVVVARGTTAIVMGGNSRAMSIARAYDDGRAASYRALLVERAGIFGVDRAALEDMTAPVLVRVCDLPFDVDTSRALNEGTTLGKGASVDAVSTSHRITPRALAILGDHVAADETLHAFLSSPAARSFVSALVTDRVISQADAPRYLRGPDLTDDGKVYVERALVARILPDPITIDGIGAARREAVARGIPALVDAQSHGHDVTADLRAALEDHAEADRRGVEPDALDDQADFFAPRRSRSTTPAALAFRRVLTGSGGPARLVRFLRAFATSARAHPAGQSDLEHGDPWSTAEIVTRTAESMATR